MKKTSTTPDPETPALTWLPGNSPHRNQFLIFQREFSLPSKPTSARLDLFSDTRYRLWINGTVAGHGPARFHPSAPEYDSYDLLPYLGPGRNRVVVEVWSANAPTFQAVDAPGVFWADGVVLASEGERISLSTPAHWTGLESLARESLAIPWSFAIGPVEILHQALWQEEMARPGVPVEPVASGHGIPQPRSIPPAVCSECHPTRVLYAGPGSTGRERRIGAFRFFPDFQPGYVSKEPREPRVAVLAGWLFSPGTTHLKMGSFWSDFCLNGEVIQSTADSTLGNRHDFEVAFKEGWNFIAAKFRVPAPVWGLPLGFPEEAGIFATTAPDEDAERGLWMSDLFAPAEAPDLATLSTKDFTADPLWQRVPETSLGLAPAREVGWDAPATSFDPLPFQKTEILTAAAGPDGLAIFTFAFDREFLGRPVFCIEGPGSMTVDVTCDEWLRNDGTVDVFRGLYSVHSTDRFLLPSGRSQVETFHSRGGHYLQLNIRTSPGATVTLSNLRVVETKTAVHNSSDFRCEDEFLQWCWDASVRTLESSLEDIWSDSPWREQGCYLGDSLVQFHAHTCLSDDLRLPARILRLWAQCQNPDGQIPPVVPAHLTRPLPDFSLLYVRFVRDYFRVSGDIGLVREVWPCLQKLLDSPTWEKSPQGLFSTTVGHLFIDWSVEAEARLGCSSVLNAFFLSALESAAELATSLGENPSPWQARHDSLLTAFRQHLWDEKNGRFLCTILPDGTRVLNRALHANALAWSWNLGDPTQTGRILPWLLEELRDNADKIIAHREAQPSYPRTTSGQIEPYFLFFFLDELGARGHLDEARRIIRDTWGIMRERGATTLWESVVASAFGDGSWCHSWSVAPMIFASRYLRN